MNELKQLRLKARKVDGIKWASRPQLFDLSYLHPETYIDKNNIGGEGGIGGLLRGDYIKRGEFIHLQTKVNELYDRRKKRKDKI